MKEIWQLLAGLILALGMLLMNVQPRPLLLPPQYHPNSLGRLRSMAAPITTGAIVGKIHTVFNISVYNGRLGFLLLEPMT